MLKLWFPQVTAQDSVTPNPADFSLRNISTLGKSNTTPPHKHKDQLHIPVKKRRLSWSDTDSPSSSPPVVCKRTKCCEEDPSSGTPSLSSHMNQSDKRVSETLEHKVIRWSGSRLTWVHIAPIFSPPKSGPSHEGGMANDRESGRVLLPVSPLTSRSSPATQDSFISSTTSFSEPDGCQCQSVNLETRSPLQEYTQIPQITTKPSNLEEQSPLQT
ncbi:uncharacterized protein LOC120494983 [Pimephales promelas]|nr:uncharacterized protein LOC120494983 [Pimephales promelas]